MRLPLIASVLLLASCWSKQERVVSEEQQRKINDSVVQLHRNATLDTQNYKKIATEKASLTGNYYGFKGTQRVNLSIDYVGHKTIVGHYAMAQKRVNFTGSIRNSSDTFFLDFKELESSPEAGFWELIKVLGQPTVLGSWKRFADVNDNRTVTLSKETSSIPFEKDTMAWITYFPFGISNNTAFSEFTLDFDQYGNAKVSYYPDRNVKTQIVNLKGHWKRKGLEIETVFLDSKFFKMTNPKFKLVMAGDPDGMNEGNYSLSWDTLIFTPIFY